MAENDSLTPAQQRAIAALLLERHQSDAAKAAGIAARTLARWLTRPAFQAALAAAQQAAIASAMRRLASISSLAVSTLEAVMKDEAAPPGSRVQAATVTLGRLVDLHTLTSLEARIAALEADTAKEEGQ